MIEPLPSHVCRVFARAAERVKVTACRAGVLRWDYCEPTHGELQPPAIGYCPWCGERLPSREVSPVIRDS